MSIGRENYQRSIIPILSDTSRFSGGTTAATVEGFIGFAVGRTSFWDPLVQLRAKQITRDAAVAEIARCYRDFVDIFENARSKTRAA